MSIQMKFLSFKGCNARGGGSAMGALSCIGLMIGDETMHRRVGGRRTAAFACFYIRSLMYVTSSEHCIGALLYKSEI